MPEMMDIIAWLQSHIPAGDADPTVTRISHGDFRYAASVLTMAAPIAGHACLHTMLYTLCSWKVEVQGAGGSAVHVQDMHVLQRDPVPGVGGLMQVALTNGVCAGWTTW